LKYILLLTTIFTFGFTNTTLCFKNGHADFATIEEQKFDGGECKGENSINEMKTKGWEVSDIKMLQSGEGFNFVYILKQNLNTTTAPATPLPVVATSGEIDYDKVAQAIKKKEDNDKLSSQLEEGERLYKKNCQECHGEFGKVAYKTSRPLMDISLEETLNIIRDYTYDDYDRGMAMLMKPYADLTTPDRMTSIYKYLEKINNK
jgi:mono/diheme cytochrome c family protein